jgi:adenylate cyclase
VRVAQDAATLILKDHPYRIDAGGLEAPVDAAAEMRLHFSPVETWPRRTVPAWTMLEAGASPPPALGGKIVLIGSSAPEAGAFLPVAGSPLAPTVQIQAEAIEQILTQSFLVRPPTALWWELGAMILLGLAAVAFAIWLAPGLAALAAFGLALAWIGFVVAAFLRSGFLLDPIGPALTAIVAANATELAGFIRTRALKTAIVQKFERYVPPEVVERLVREPEKLRLDGELREVTALVTDVEASRT